MTQAPRPVSYSVCLLLLLSWPWLSHSQSFVTLSNSWSYNDAAANGPAHWSTLEPSFSACNNGVQQSPVNIVAAASRPVSTQHLAIHWEDLHSSLLASASLRNSSVLHKPLSSSHSLQVRCNSSTRSHVSWRGQQFTLSQFHFHSPSEHQLNGVSHPLELHLVHHTADGQLLVVGITLDTAAERDDSASAQPQQTDYTAGQTTGSVEDFLHALIWTELSAAQSASASSSPLPSSAPLLSLLTAALTSSSPSTFYSYSGSLTTPPCTEGVTWFVLTSPLLISASQLAAYTALFHNTARPVQPLNGRQLWSVKGSGADWNAAGASGTEVAVGIVSVMALLLCVVAVLVYARWHAGDSLSTLMDASLQDNAEQERAAASGWRKDKSSVAARRMSPSSNGGGGSANDGDRDREPLLPFQSADAASAASAVSLQTPIISTSPAAARRSILRRGGSGRVGSSGSLSTLHSSSGGKGADVDDRRAEEPASSPKEVAVGSGRGSRKP